MKNKTWAITSRNRIQRIVERPWQSMGKASAWVLAAALIALTACGGGGGTTTPPPPPPSLSVATASLPNATSGASYSATLAASGGSETGYAWSLTSASVNSLPTGFTLSAGGLLSSTGNPAAADGSYSFTVQVKDSAGNTATKALTLTVQAPVNVTLQVTTASLPTATSGLAYSATLTASGGSGTGYSWSVTAATAGSLAAGFALSTGGILSSSGNPAATPAVYPFTVQVSDSAGNTATKALSLTVQAQAGVALQIVTSSLPNATTGKPYSATLAAVGGSGVGYAWSAPGFFSPLPGGFTLSPAGVLTSTGSPATAVQAYAFPIQVTDSVGNTASRALALVVQPVTPVVANFVLTDLHDFGGNVLVANGSSGLDGSYPLAGVTFDSSGNIYGTANGGGGNATYGDYDPQSGFDVYAGMVWELEPSGIYKDLHDFAGTTTNANGTSGADGWGPDAGVTLDSAGNIFGTATNGGPYTKPGYGIVWEIESSGTYKDVHDFGGTITNANGASGADGYYPVGGVIFDSAGNMYGTTYAGGANNAGMVWEIESSGTYKDLHDFGGTVTNAGGGSGADGATPNANVAFDSSGNMYGTATTGGPNKEGMVWEITASGVYLDLHDFGGTITNAGGSSGTDGEKPYSAVTIDNAGNMYGTAEVGGANNAGIVWEIASSKTYKDLHDFGGTVINADGLSGPDGIGPYLAGVSLDSSGNLYGTTLVGGQYRSYALPNNVVSAGGGIVWEITSSGTYKDLYDFIDGGTAQWGFWPAAGVTLDNSGNIYGMTSGGYDDDAPVDTMVWKLAAASTKLPAPSISPNGIVPIGSGTAVAESIAPGQSISASFTSAEWVSIYGSNLAGSTVNWTGTSPNLSLGNMSWTGDFPTSLGGTSVFINGVAAFLSFVSPNQIILQVPQDIGSTSVCCANQVTGPVLLTVTTAGGTAFSAVTLTDFAAPSFLMIDDKHVAGIILRSNGSGAYGGGTYDIIGPTGNSLGYPTVAAKAGDNIELFAIGLAPTTAAQAWQGSALLDGNGTDVLINNVEVLHGATPLGENGLALSGSGLFQISLTLPSGLGAGDLPITAAVGVLQEGAALTSPNVVISLQ